MIKLSTKKSIPLYGLVLTGGKSTRMKTDKSALQYQGEPQARRAFYLLSEFCEHVFISTRKELASAAYQNDLPQIHDYPEFSAIGPLGGILSAMSEHPHAAWLILAADLPHVKSSTIKTVLARRDRKRFATAYRSVHDGLPEPLCAVYEPAYRDRLYKFLKEGIQCPRKIMINSDVKLIKQTDPRSLDNINTPEEYQKALKRIKTKIKK